MEKAKLAIFNRFKTRQMQLTGEAKRQRMIITVLANRSNPTDRTRTGIAQKIAEKEDLFWRDIYSGIFRDLDEVLLPLGIVKEEGRLPPKRGPKALREEGVPYYHLTRAGILTALALDGIKDKKTLLDTFFMGAESRESKFAGILTVLSETSPAFTSQIIRLYVKAFCEGQIGELLPFDLARLGAIQNEALKIQGEIVGAFAGLPKDEQNKTLELLNEIWQDPALADGKDDDQREMKTNKDETDSA